jgi:hypothetical protein
MAAHFSANHLGCAFHDRVSVDAKNTHLIRLKSDLEMTCFIDLEKTSSLVTPKALANIHA